MNIWAKATGVESRKQTYIGYWVLSEVQTNRVWDKMIRAEVRSLYFADLATKYTKTKKLLNALSLFFASGAAVTIGIKSPPLVSISMSVIAALASAYSISFNLDTVTSNLVVRQG
jgi:hypothetical protein